MRHKKQVEIIIYRKIHSSVEFLILKRTVKKGAFWQPITGGVENNESIIEAGYRELYEETGISEFLSFFDLEFHFSFIENGIFYTETVFGCEVNPLTEIKLSEEHLDFKWCQYSEAKLLLKWDSNKQALQKLNEILTN